MLLKEGIGWGYVPEHTVRDDIEKGALVGSINLERTRSRGRGCAP
jgi:DNA-binding transcriptional LysR family regulator